MKNSNLTPKIKRICIGQLTIYEVSESELKTLEEGSPNSIYLNFSIFLLSVAISFLIALLTTTIKSQYVFIVFVLVTIIGFLFGIFLIIIWFKNHKSISNIINTIKNRKYPEGIQEKELK